MKQLYSTRVGFIAPSLPHLQFCFAAGCLACLQSELMSAGARLGLTGTDEAALLSTVLHARR